MSPTQWVYAVAVTVILAAEGWALFNNRSGDTITGTVERSPIMWVPLVVLCAWALGHFTLGVWAERVGGIAMLILAPLVWRSQRPDLRRRR